MFRALSSAANPLLRRASDHVFSIGSVGHIIHCDHDCNLTMLLQSITETRNIQSDSDSNNDGVVEETFSDGTSDGELSESKINIDAL